MKVKKIKKDTDFRDIKKYIYQAACSKGNRSREESCQYRGGKNSDKFCIMTTNTGCSGCKFYSPSTLSVFRAAYEEVVNANEVYEESIKAEAKIEGMLIDMHLYVEETRKMMAKIKDIYEKLYITAWQDSINSYE